MTPDSCWGVAERLMNKYHHRSGESLAEKKERLLELAVKFGLIEIKHIPHETSKMASFNEQYRNYLRSFLEDMSAKGERKFDENKMLDVILGYVRKFPECDAGLYEYLRAGNKKEKVADLRRICELMVLFMVRLDDEGVAYQ